MEPIKQPFTLGKLTLRNRTVMPPMVIFGVSDESGRVSEENILHYARRARGMVGLIIVEATCVHPEGRLCADQLGLWEDGQIEGHLALTDSVHAYDAAILVQLHHAGLKSVGGAALSAGDYDDGTRKATAMTTAQVYECIRWFVEAAQRAQQAGYDGVELHAAHGYLFTQFLSEAINARTDEFGGSMENRARIVTEVIGGIKQACGPDFLIGIRMGFNEPDLETSAQFLALFEQAGVELCHASTGYEAIHNFPDPPQGYPFAKRVYGGGLLHRDAKVPVIVLGEVRDFATANAILEAGEGELIAFGRALLADDLLIARELAGEQSDRCLLCERCAWYSDGKKCPARIRARLKGQKLF